MYKDILNEIDRISNIPLRQVIEEFGGTFLNDKQFIHPIWGSEKTPSGFIYNKQGKEKFFHFKSGEGGDAIDFVKLVTSAKNNIEAIKIILNNSSKIINLDNEKIEEYKKQEITKAKMKIEKERKKMFAIIHNSIPVTESKLAMLYFKKRKLNKVVSNFSDPNIKILMNTFKMNDGKEINNIVYLFNGNKKNRTHKFVIYKTIDTEGNKTGNKYNLLESRPILYYKKMNRPVIICEGMEDGLSSLVLGYDNFISLNSTSNINKLIIQMNLNRKFFTSNYFEVCLDNDEAGKVAMNKLKIFCNLAELYENNEVEKLIKVLQKIASKNINPKNNMETLIKELNTEKDLRKIEPNTLISIINNLSKILKYDFFHDYGKYYKVTESQYYNKFSKHKCKDLNEILVYNKYENCINNNYII